MPGDILVARPVVPNTSLPAAMKSFATPKKQPASDRRQDLQLLSEHEKVYEQDVLRMPGEVKPWLHYVSYKKKHGNVYQLAFVLDRAVTALPKSYKLWKMYLELRTGQVKGKNPAKYAAHYIKINALFERALILLNKMPRIWEMYLQFLMLQPLAGTTRYTFDRALRALPIRQQPRIWALYKPFAEAASGETAVMIWSRYVKIHPEEAETYIDLLIDMRKYTEAVRQYIAILNNPKFKSKEAKGHFELYQELVKLLVDHAEDIQTGEEVGIDVDRIIRGGIAKFSDQQGTLWNHLANYWGKKEEIERQRDVFEEAITSVMTQRDFNLVFDAYVETEEKVLESKIKRIEQVAAQNRMDENASLDLDIGILRFQQLTQRRPFLSNDVLLRQNPSNVNEWKKRVLLWGDNREQVLQTYTDAVAAIDPKRATGQLYELWMDWAKVYEESGDLNAARLLLDKAVKVSYKNVNELAELYCAWAELELRHENFDKAVEVMARATQGPKRSSVDYFDEDLSPQQRVHKSWKLWSFYVDLVESVGTLEETQRIYERVFELRIATPQTVVNYANLLEENKYFEESFKVYERGLDLFTYPVAFELWNMYLSKAVERRIGMERLRDLFEQALENCPAKFAKVIYLMYGSLEEERGLARHAMRIYERATREVADEDRFDMFQYYITKSASNFGLPSTRPIYERAIHALPDKEAKDMCLKFADMERRLGEIDRARAILTHAAQFCDPRTSADFWQKWESFEVAHGNEDTFKEMLRVKRTVQTQYNTDASYIASQAVARNAQAADSTDGETLDGKIDAMAALERASRAPAGFVAASSGPEGGNKENESKAPANPDAIDVDLDDL